MEASASAPSHRPVPLFHREYAPAARPAPSGDESILAGECLVFDTETTGLSADARLVELAAARVRGGRVVERFHTLVNPEVPIPWHAARVHGIRDPMVRGAPDARTALRALLRFGEGLPWIAHNARFDRRILVQELARTELASPGVHLYCTLQLARRCFPEAPSHSLGRLAEHLGLEAPTHRAMADVETTVGVLRACLERPGAGAAWSPLATL